MSVVQLSTEGMVVGVWRSPRNSYMLQSASHAHGCLEKEVATPEKKLTQIIHPKAPKYAPRSESCLTRGS